MKLPSLLSAERACWARDLDGCQGIPERIGGRGEDAGGGRDGRRNVGKGVRGTLNRGRLVADVDRHHDGIAEIQAVIRLVLEGIGADVSSVGW